jgi:acyl dehydratase
MSDDNFSVYRVCARNTAAESENKIHDDGVAARFGFRGGLVPGVTVYGYMTVPVVERFGLEWIERGRMQVKFLQPFYEGDEVIVRAEIDSTSLRVTASREDGTLCAAG